MPRFTFNPSGTVAFSEQHVTLNGVTDKKLLAKDLTKSPVTAAEVSESVALAILNNDQQSVESINLFVLNRTGFPNLFNAAVNALSVPIVDPAPDQTILRFAFTTQPDILHIPNLMEDLLKQTLSAAGWTLVRIEPFGNQIVIDIVKNGSLTLLAVIAIIVGVIAVLGIIAVSYTVINADNEQTIQQADLSNREKTRLETTLEIANNPTLDTNTKAMLIDAINTSYLPDTISRQDPSLITIGGAGVGIGVIAAVGIGAFLLSRR